ncbi:MAG: phosphate ABC transporter permease PstA [Planctomycetes bacterium]|nr:phosphate ABC transporter permease PstA [Planctomycetota bacterium]
MIDIQRLINRRKRQDLFFNFLGIACTLVGIITLLALMGDLAYSGLTRIDWQFLTSYPSSSAEKAGVLPALVGSLLLMFITVSLAVPLGVAAGVYLEEYSRKNWLTTVIEINIANLAGVPSIIYGLMALSLLVYQFHLGRTLVVGGITLALLILPIVIVSTREALRAIPNGIREAAYALGATRWQVIKDHLLPYSAGGIATGTIIAMSRAIGETAPLITIGVPLFISVLPDSPFQSTAPFVNFDWLTAKFTVLPIQMFNWVSRPDPAFHRNAAAAGLVLITLTLSLNAVAIVIRYRLRKKIKW